MEPIPESEVSVKASDLTRTAYDQGTLLKLADKLTTHFLWQDADIEVENTQP